MRYATIILLSLSLAACGGRAPNPVLTYQPGDKTLSCDAIAAEEKMLTTRIMVLREEVKKRDHRNLVIGIFGPLLIFIPYAFLDSSSTIEDDEISVFYRQRQLANIKQQRGCAS